MTVTTNNPDNNYYNSNEFLDDPNISWMKELTAHPEINSNFSQLSDNHISVVNKLGDLSNNVFYESESDYPLVPFHFSLKEFDTVDDGSDLTPEKFLELVQTVNSAKKVLEDKSATVQDIELSQFKTYLEDTQNIDESNNIIQLIEQVEELSKEHNTRLKIFKIKYECYSTIWITLVDSEDLVGLMTIGIST
jgi:hypothetical protein